MFSTRRDNDAYDDDDPTAWLMELIEYNRNVPWMQTTMSVRLTHRAFIESAICKCWWVNGIGGYLSMMMSFYYPAVRCVSVIFLMTQP